jgi:2-iminobutanoate/2-iminopropanoate deaminase
MTHTYVNGGGDGVPASSGAYTPAVVAEPLCFVSGQSPVDPVTGELVSGGVLEQTDQTLTNLFAILAAAGFEPTELVSVTIVLIDIADWAQVNAAYAARLPEGRRPARMMVQASAVLPEGARLEIQAVAARSGGAR